jgi:hypothetical protein
MAIRSMIGKLWGPSPECAKLSWTGVIRPALTYGAICIVWSRSASHRWTKIKFQRLQRMALSQIAHVRPGSPSAALEIMYGVPPLDLFIQNCAQIRQSESNRTPPGNPLQKTKHELLMVDTFPTPVPGWAMAG